MSKATTVFEITTETNDNIVGEYLSSEDSYRLTIINGIGDEVELNLSLEALENFKTEIDNLLNF